MCIKILGEGVVLEGSLTQNRKEALDRYMKQGYDFITQDVVLKPWQRELIEHVNNPTHINIIWVVGKAC